MTKTFSLRTPLGQAKGLGSSKHGTDHWISQRLSAIALVFLGLWLVWALLKIGGYTPSEIKEWLGSPAPLLGMMLTVIVSLYHGYLGLQTVIEDYVSSTFWKNSLLIFFRFLHIGLGGIAGLALLKISFSVSL
jgi:succinate dehydrogenase / fumarate reductase membrane anchor subunit